MEEQKNAASPHARTLLVAQSVSGLVFASFLALHLLNLFAALAGPAMYDRVQAIFRGYYQHPWIELGVLSTALAVHIVTGILRIRARKGRSSKTRRRSSWRILAHRGSAYFLLLALGGHVFATRILPLLEGMKVGSAGLLFTFWWMPAFFYPYYLLLAMAGIYHMLYGAAVAFAVLRVRVGTSPKRWTSIFVLLVALLLCLAALFVLGGGGYDSPDPTQSDFAHYFLEAFSGKEDAPAASQN